MREKIVNYIIAHGDTADELYFGIQHMMLAGWQPLGGVSFKKEKCMFKDAYTYCQAMVKYETA